MKETTEVPITLTFGIFLSKKEGKWKSLIVSSKNVNGSLNPTSYYSPQLYYFFPPKIPQTEAQGEGRWIWKKDFCFFIAIHQVQAFPGVHFESYPGLQTCTGKLQSSHTHTLTSSTVGYTCKKPQNFAKLLHLTAIFKTFMPEADCFAPLPRGSILPAASEGNV